MYKSSQAEKVKHENYAIKLFKILSSKDLSMLQDTVHALHSKTQMKYISFYGLFYLGDN